MLGSLNSCGWCHCFSIKTIQITVLSCIKVYACVKAHLPYLAKIKFFFLCILKFGLKPIPHIWHIPQNKHLDANPEKYGNKLLYYMFSFWSLRYTYEAVCRTDPVIYWLHAIYGWADIPSALSTYGLQNCYGLCYPTVNEITSSLFSSLRFVLAIMCS